MEYAGLEFLNSLWHDWHGSGRHEDRLEQPEWVADFLAQWQLKIDAPLDTAALAALKDLRNLLRRSLETLVAGQALAPADMQALNNYLRGSLFSRQLSSDTASPHYRLALQPTEKNWAWVLAELAASFAELIGSPHIERLRICGNPECKWVFYDSSRNKSRRWCEDSTCGSLNRVRRFRERHKPTSSNGSKMV